MGRCYRAAAYGPRGSIEPALFQVVFVEAEEVADFMKASRPASAGPKGGAVGMFQEIGCCP